MPDDGPIVRAGLPRRYQGAYKQLCEGHFDGKERARTVARAIRNDIRDSGDAILAVIAQAADQLDRLQTPALINEVIDWAEQRSRIDHLIQRAMLPRRYVARSMRQACREVLAEIENGSQVPNLDQEIMQKHLWRIYESRFGEHLYRPQHHLGVDQRTINERVREMLPFLLLELVAFANQMESRKTVSRLRLRARSRRESSISLDTDLLSVSK